MHAQMLPRAPPKSKLGKAPYLTGEEVREMVEFLIKCSEFGFPKTKDEILELAMGKRGGKGWWLRFLER